MKSKANTSKRVSRNAFQQAAEAAFNNASAKQPKPRRSIPVGEVKQMLESIKKERTIYDERSVILNRLRECEDFIEHFQKRVHETQIQNKQLRAELARVNLAITRQLELDGE